MEAPSAAAGASSNRYEILARLAAGGMAELYLARATAPDGVVSHVVLKRILPSRSHDPQFVTMFLDEARLAAQLHHPNIAQVFDIGRLGTSYFFTMEYVHGENARAVLQREYGLRRKVPISHAITIAVGAATGLAHAHDATGIDRRPLGIVHRDVSPANIMVSFDGAVKLVDFGVAKAAVRFHQTRAGTIKGKIAYLSPEQCTGNKPVDRRSDVFSLGIVLYELLTVQRLFRRDSDFATMAAIVTDDMPPPSSMRPEVPPALDEVVMTALAKQPEDRYPSAAAMVDALERAATTSGIALSVGGLGRYLKELFGVRPEPWIELDSLEQHPNPVTVTGESMIQIPTATPIGPAASMWPGGETPLPEPMVGEAAEIEAALIRTVRLEAVPQPDDDEFLVTRNEAKLAARRLQEQHDEAIEDRPTVIDDRMPEMPSDLELTTPIDPMEPVRTPPVPVAALPIGTPPPARVATPTGPPPVPGGKRPTPVPAPPTLGPTTPAVPPPPTLPQFLNPPGTLPAPPAIPQHTPPVQPIQYARPPDTIPPGEPVPLPPILPGQPVFTPHHGMPVMQPDLPPWSSDTQIDDGATIRRRTSTAHPAKPGLFKLRTKLIVAGIGMIVAALIIRAATQHSKPAEPAPITKPQGPSLPPP